MDDLTLVEAEVDYAPECVASASSTSFSLTVDGTVVATLTGLSRVAVSSLVIAWRQGCFCGLVGEDLLEVLAIYAGQ